MRVAEDEQQKNTITIKKMAVKEATYQIRAPLKIKANYPGKRIIREGLKCKNCNKIRYPDWWENRQRRAPNNQKKLINLKPKGLAVGIEFTPIPRLNVKQYKKFNETKHEANMAGKISFHRSWVINSRATEHISYDDSVLINLKESPDGAPVKIPNGDNVHVQGIWSSCLPSDLSVDNVLYIPDYKYNILSISKFTKNHNCFDLQLRKLIGMGRCKDGLYNVEDMDASIKSIAIKVDTKSWHRRLGHVSNSRLQNISFFNTIGEIDHCDSCIKAKQAILPFQVSFIKTSAPLDLIHCDIWWGGIGFLRFLEPDTFSQLLMIIAIPLGITVSRDVKFIKSIFRLHNIEEYNIKDENRNRNHVGSNPLDDTYDDETDTILDTTDQVHVVDHPVPNNNSSASTSP
uniref:GAG-pre-integrase domain-containing protein n=1 Tax=Lactuca sativa TaxID=4236 RepID=A0A9R1UEI0_LACSA|nr:hypothetical protein LSAT_V11C900482860 [Lactuca sativa]